MRLQIKESTHELTILEKQNPHIGKRLQFIRSLKASPFTNLGTTLRNNGVNANDAGQWLQLYMIGGVGLLMNASIKDPSITGMPLSYSTLSRYVPAERLNRFSVGFLPTQQTQDNSSWGIGDLIRKGACAIGISSACTGAAPPKKRDKQRLINAQNAARMNPKFQPSATTTHCNQATCAVVQEVGGPMGPLTDKKGNPLRANQQAQNLARSNEYREVTAEEAQQIANDGGLVIAAYENPSGGSGHVATVRPEGVLGDNPPRGGGPLLNDIGRNVRVAPRNYAFSKDKTVLYYTPKGN